MEKIKLEISTPANRTEDSACASIDNNNIDIWEFGDDASIESVTAKAELIIEALKDYRGKGFAENCIILSCDFHTHRRYDDFYTKRGQQLNGFTGIYDYILRMAEALTAFENEDADTWENFDWVEVSETFVSETMKAALVDHLAPMPEPRAMIEAAIAAIRAKEAARKAAKA